MKTRLPYLTLLLAVLLAPVARAQDVDTDVDTQKLGQTGMKFLSTSVDARASALGGAMTAETNGNSVALFYNPASMARMQGTFHVNLAQTQWITDIDYNIVSVAWQPQGNYGVFGLSFVDLSYGEFFQTVRDESEQGFIELGTYEPNAYALGLGYARAFSDRFSVGAQVKYAVQDLGSHAQNRNDAGNLQFRSYDVNTVAFDFGILYNTGFESLTLAMSVRNFSRELTYVRDRFELPLTFQIGVSMDLIDLTSLDPSQHQLDLFVDAQRPRDFSEHMMIGAEYTFMDLISLRAGMEQAFVDHEEGVSLGAGLHTTISNFRFGADYAYTSFGVFGDLNRFGVNIGF